MLTQLKEMFAYNRWANERLFGACEPISADDLTRELGGSFPSIWKTLTHVYGAENSWLARWNGTPAGQLPDLEGTTTLAQLHEKWNALYDRQSAWLATVSEEDIRRPIKIIFRDGTTFDQQLAGTMRHCMNHSTYHRGQVTNFLRMLGAKAVGLDLALYYREHPPAP